MDKISEKMYEALSLKYRSEMAEAEATLLVYFTNTPFTQTYDYSGLYEGSHLVNYKNIFPYREASLCNNPCSSYK